jgi:hypothetical protein
VIVGVALAGTFSGAGGQQGQLGYSPDMTSATTQPAGTGPGSNGLVEGSATKEATARPAPGASGSRQSSGGSGTESGPGALCHQYWAFISRSGSSASSKAEEDNLQQLSVLAGGPWNVNRYCMSYAPGPAGASDPGPNPGGPDFQVPGDEQGSQGKNPPQQHGGDGTGNGGNGTGNGSGGTGNGGNGNDHGGNGSGGAGMQ